MFRLPWKVHGLRKAHGAPHDLLVEIEHTHLLELYERALIAVDGGLAAEPPPKYSGTPAFLARQKLKHDREHYAEMILWLRDLQK